MKIKGYEKKDEMILEKIGSEGKRLLKKVIADMEWKDVTVSIKEKVDEYKELGYNSDEIEIFEEYTLKFHSTDIVCEKRVYIKTIHSRKSIYLGEKYIHFTDEYFTKARNETGVELREKVSEAMEEVKEELEDEEEEDC